MFRIVTKSITGKAQFHTSLRASAAQVFRMPAMSPTMSEGGITSWKVEPGQEFAAGDVLLEVETDKATIDVEAQDDGIMWEILEKNGVSGIPVGKPIAFLAEPGDDLSSLEKPRIDEPEPPKEEPKEEPKKASPPPAKKSSNSHSEIFTTANPDQTFFPSVEILLHQNHISREDALAKIPASGPQGRILHGDVLAYLGKIDKSVVESVTSYIKSKEHLDLSNIKLKAPEPVEEKPAEKAVEEVPKPTNVLTLRLTAKLDVAKDQFQYAFENSVHNAIRKTYSTRFPEYSISPSSKSTLSSDDIFDDLMAPPPTASRFQVYDIKYTFPASSPNKLFAPLDAFDDLMSVPTPVTKPVAEEGEVNVEFKVKFDEKLIDSVDFVEYFQESLLEQIPTKQIVKDL